MSSLLLWYLHSIVEPEPVIYLKVYKASDWDCREHTLSPSQTVDFMECLLRSAGDWLGWIVAEA